MSIVGELHESESLSVLEQVWTFRSAFSQENSRRYATVVTDDLLKQRTSRRVASGVFVLNDQIIPQDLGLLEGNGVVGNDVEQTRVFQYGAQLPW